MLLPGLTAPVADQSVSSLSTRIASRRRRLSIADSTWASHVSPTSFETELGVRETLKPSSRASRLEK